MNIGFAFIAAAAAASPSPASESLDDAVFGAQIIYGKCVVSEAVRLDDGRESASSLAEAGATACFAARTQMIEILTNAIIARTPEIPRTSELRKQAAVAAVGSMDALSAQAQKLAVVKVLDLRAKAKK